MTFGRFFLFSVLGFSLTTAACGDDDSGNTGTGGFGGAVGGASGAAGASGAGVGGTGAMGGMGVGGSGATGTGGSGATGFGGSGATGSGATGGTGTGGGNTTCPPSPAPPTVMCTMIGTGDMACDMCAHTSCCSQLEGCFRDASCGGAQACLQQFCATVTDPMALQQCAMQNCGACFTSQATVDLYNAIPMCLQANCAMACPVN